MNNLDYVIDDNDNYVKGNWMWWFKQMRWKGIKLVLKWNQRQISKETKLRNQLS